MGTHIQNQVKLWVGWAGKIAQQRTPAALPQDLGLSPHNRIPCVTSAPGDPMTSPSLHRLQAHMRHIDLHAGKISIYIE